VGEGGRGGGGGVNGVETGPVVSRSNFDAGVRRARRALDLEGLRCGCVDYVVTAGANLWDLWELAHSEQGGIRLIAPNIVHGRLRKTNLLPIHNH
jgi:hypothetical protein